jgi:hypothetical protein
MGHWSVNCGISNIPITCGQECVVLLIRKARIRLQGESWMSSVLPIYGYYDNYGGLESIEENENTKMIESYFNHSIHDFVYFFTRGCISIEEVEEEFPELMENIEIKNWSFMFIDRKVFDFLSTHNSYMEFDETKLNLLGFSSLEGNRYKKQDKVFHLVYDRLYGSGLKTFDRMYDHIDKLDLTDEEIKLAKSSKFQLWRHYTYDMEFMQSLLNSLGLDRLDMISLVGISNNPIKSPKDIQQMYINMLIEKNPFIIDEMVKLLTLRINIGDISSYFKPHELYVTKQDGARRESQMILEKFVEINRNYLEEEKL